MPNLIQAMIVALTSVLSAYGAGSLYAFFYGQETEKTRFGAIIIGLVTAFIVINAQLYLAYHGFQSS